MTLLVDWEVLPVASWYYLQRVRKWFIQREPEKRQHASLDLVLRTAFCLTSSAETKLVKRTEIPLWMHNCSLAI